MGNPSVRHSGACLQTILEPNSPHFVTRNSAAEPFCSHETLLLIDQKAPYTAVSNAVMRHVIGNRDLACCSSLWLLIRFEQSGFHDREYITRTVGWLAKALNVSTSTIQKWQKRLMDHGYLEIIEQRVDGHHNAPNRYRACLPKSIAESLLNQLPTGKERSGPKEPISNDKTLKEKPASIGTDVAKINVSDIDDLFSQAPSWFRMLLPGLRFELVDQNIFCITGVNAMAQKVILQVRAELLQRLKELGHTPQGLSFNRDQINHRLSLPQEPDDSEDTKTYQMVSPPLETLNPHTKHRLLKLIQGSRINGSPLTADQAKRVCEEVAYAMESGSLTGFPTLKAMHIALKLIRQNRWRTPYGFISNR